MRSVEKINLKYSKPIKPSVGQTNLSRTDTSKRIPFKTKVLHLDKQIGIYRMWFRFLKLGLELEQMNYKVRGMKNDKLIPIKVNHKFYKDWDLDLVLTTSFDKWISVKRDLFLDNDHIELVEKINDTNQYYYIEVDKSLSQRKLRRLITELTDKLPDRKQPKKKNYFTPLQQHKYPNLHIYYNVFILSRTKDWKRKDYMDKLSEMYWGYSRRLTKPEQKLMSEQRKRGLKENEKEISMEFQLPNTENSIRRCLRRGEEVLIDVCKGKF